VKGRILSSFPVAKGSVRLLSLPPEGHGIRCQAGSGNRGEMHDRGHVADPIIDLGKCYRLAEVSKFL
jgi:hypothetical protein